MTIRNRRRRPGAVPLTLAAVASLLLAGCSAASSHATWKGTGTPSAAAETGKGGAASGPATLTISPGTGAKDVAPAAGVAISAGGATAVTAVTVSAGSHRIAGSLSADGHTWKSTGKLAFGTKYTVKVTATGVTAGTATTTTFTTAEASRTIKPALWTNDWIRSLANNGTFGVGQTVNVHLNRSVPGSERAAIEKALVVTTTPAVEGRWHWVDDQDVHYRPEKYWATGTTITVHADLYGVKLASGVYGGSSITRTIHIGDSHVAIADYKSHHMKVYINGELVKNIPISMGVGGFLNGGSVVLWTRNGPHVVLMKTPYTYMSSGGFGLTDKNSPYYFAREKVYDTVRIADTGEFVHLRTWSISQIGHENTSHGCINVGNGNAQYMYKLLVPGDVVDVVGSPTELPVTDGLGDWTVSWSKW